MDVLHFVLCYLYGSIYIALRVFFVVVCYIYGYVYGYMSHTVKKDICRAILPF